MTWFWGSEYLVYLEKERRYSLKTVEAYRKDLDGFGQFLELIEQEGSPWGKEEVRLWVIQLLEEGLSPTTIRRKLSALSGFCKFEIRQGRRTDNPIHGVIIPKLQPQLPTFVPEKDVRQILENLRYETFEEFRDAVIILLLYSTGMRRSELLNLKWSDWDGASQLKVLGKGGKERMLVLPHMMMNILKNFRRFLSDNQQNSVTYIVCDKNGGKIYPKLVYRVVNNYLSEGTTLSKRSPHVLRHSYATHLLGNGADISSIQKLLGHSSLRATQVYTHTTIEQLKSIHQAFHPRGRAQSNKE